MEFNQKARGQKHHYNKARYQNKAKIIPKATEKESSNKSRDNVETEETLPSNWHYNELPIEDEDAVDASTNFSLLAQAPISHGGHFQFKSDKNMESEFDFDSLRDSKLFSLDLCRLESSLNTIPFHERCDLDKSYLTNSQLRQVHERSQQNKVQYESYLKITSITKEFSGHTVSEYNKNKKLSKSTKDLEDDIDSLLGKESSIDENEKSEGNSLDKKDSSNPDTGAQNEEKRNLEEWLDDILND